MDLINITINYVAVKRKDQLFFVGKSETMTQVIAQEFQGTHFSWACAHLSTTVRGLVIQSSIANVYIIIQGNKGLT